MFDKPFPTSLFDIDFEHPLLIASGLERYVSALGCFCWPELLTW